MYWEDEYLDARKKGLRYIRQAQSEGKYPFLPALDDLLGREGEGLSRVNLGVREVPLSMVVGTKTAGRQNSFAGNWMPVLEKETEFASKWTKVYGYQMNEGISDPIICFEYMKKFYVQEGNKRVSVLKYFDVPSVEAEVIRILPAKTGDEAVRTYYEFVNFYKVCPVYEIDFTRPGEYKRFVELLGLSLTEPWPSETVKATEAAYYRFLRAYKIKNPNGIPGMTPADALLVYLSFYTMQSLVDQPRSVVESRIGRLSEEFLSEVNVNNIALQKAPAAEAVEKNRGFFASFFNAPQVYTEAHPLKVSFLYDGNPDESSWIADEEVGRFYLNHRFEGRIRTKAYFNCTSGDAITEAIANAAKEGSHVIITTSPAMMPRTVRASIHYDKIIFLNMSLNLSHRTVRTYYSRMYEAKFLLGALAASCCKNHKLGYLADNPIYGDIANINAFAIGAAIVDPDCKVYLSWSTTKDNDWRKAFQNEGIRVISGPDYAKFGEDAAEQGLYQILDDGTFFALALPIFHWGKYYELIVRTILDGTYMDDPSAEKNQATNYWYGLSAGVVDINLSSEISYYSRKLIAILKKGIIAGTVDPFAGEINTQTFQLKKKGSKVLDDDSIIRMVWLNDNVIGRIPSAEELNDPARDVAA
ncbi:MAG: BMP family ABC transporter substrate-binding protein, partial [Solobacterium sp.]|nr:BMP family ABC transporter substrate-binding protein [Solobacterium sp.]